MAAKFIFMRRLNLAYFRPFFLILFALLHENIYSQNTLHNDIVPKYWVNLGVGGSSAGLSGGLGISYQTGNKLISLRFISNSKYSETMAGGQTTPETIWDVGALYGLISKRSFGYISISGGVSLVGGKIHGEYLGNINWINTYEQINVITPGIPLEAQIFLTPFRSLGLGVNVFANLNPKKTFGGVLFCIQIGKLR
jgi:hypothetical protein